MVVASVRHEHKCRHVCTQGSKGLSWIMRVATASYCTSPQNSQMLSHKHRIQLGLQPQSHTQSQPHLLTPLIAVSAPVNRPR